MALQVQSLSVHPRLRVHFLPTPSPATTTFSLSVITDPPTLATTLSSRSPSVLRVVHYLLQSTLQIIDTLPLHGCDHSYEIAIGEGVGDDLHNTQTFTP